MSQTELNREEEIQDRPFTARLMWRLLSYLGRYRRRVVFTLAIMLVHAAATQATPYLTQIAVDDHILAGDLGGLRSIMWFFMACIGLQYVSQYVSTVVTEMTGQFVMRDLRKQIFVHLQHLPLSYFDRTPVGRIMTRTTNDVEALNDFFTDGIVSVFMDLFTLAAIFGYMATMDLRLTLAACFVVPFLTVTTFYLQGLAMRAERELRLRLARLNSYLQENITGMEVVQLFGRQERNRAEFAREHIPYRKAEDREIRCYSIFFPLTEFITAVGLSIIVWYGAHSILDLTIEMGVLIAFLQYVPRFFRPIMDINDRYVLLQGAMASSERIFQLLDTNVEPASGTQSAKAQLGSAIEFRHVFFKYEINSPEWVLADVSFRIEPGESLAIVGATGSGKTTIISLICRFYDIQQGTILVDGLDVQNWNVDDLRQRIGIVQQDVFLFSGDIQSNIRLGGNHISPTQVEQAAETVNAKGFIDCLPKRFRHPVAERGATFSSGERQLIAFARALAFAPEVLVLDEATSSIDTETEQLIQDGISKLMLGRTSIIIAHRLSTIRSADQILVLHRGEIRENGRHQELLRQGGIYAKLHQLNYHGTA